MLRRGEALLVEQRRVLPRGGEQLLELRVARVLCRAQPRREAGALAQDDLRERVEEED